MESYPWINKATVTVGLYLESKFIRSKRQAKRHFLWSLLITLQSNLQKLNKTKLETDFKLDVNEKKKATLNNFLPLISNTMQNKMTSLQVHCMTFLCEIFHLLPQSTNSFLQLCRPVWQSYEYYYKVSLGLLVLHIHALTVWSFCINDVHELISSSSLAMWEMFLDMWPLQRHTKYNNNYYDAKYWITKSCRNQSRIERLQCRICDKKFLCIANY